MLQGDPTARQFVQSDGTLLAEVLRALYGFPESEALVREKLYAALKDEDLPTPVIQQLSKGHDISYLGMNISKQYRTIVLPQPGCIKDTIQKYKPDKQ